MIRKAEKAEVDYADSKPASLHTDRQAFMAEIADRVKKARETIDVEKTVEALQACVAGTKVLDKEQVAAARILLAKVLPDLKAVEHSGEVNNPHRTLSADELDRRIGELQRKAGTAEAAGRETTTH